MQISWNWLSERVDLTGLGNALTAKAGVTPQVALADRLTARGLEVEEVRSLGQGFEKVVTAQILERNPHPQADRLSLCKVQVGAGKVLEIVCGAQNMKAGDIVAAALVGAELPNGMKIAQSKIRGVESFGMLCSEEELGLAPESEGILILPSTTEVGKPLAEVLGRDDTLFTLKLTANRADCLSHWGIAREVASALGVKPKRLTATSVQSEGSPIQTRVSAQDAGLQFWGVHLTGVRVGPSPEWLVKKLESIGQRSINNVVDATNWLMLETGQPVHAYDADRLQGDWLEVRFAKEGERIPLLDGTEVVLCDQDLVIADRQQAVSLAGIMGGGNSEVSTGTQEIFLECAEFAPSRIRKTASRLGKKTDASHRFERGVDPTALPWVISLLTHQILNIAGGKINGGAVARHEMRNFVGDPAAERAAQRRIRVESDYFSKFLGMQVSAAEIREVLTALDCEIEGQGGQWNILVPHYRLDLSLPEDLAEEVARSLGYSRIEETLPSLSTEPMGVGASLGISRLALLNQAKALLASSGFSEVLNYSFTSQGRLKAWGLSSSTVRVVNPLSEEHEWMVPSLLPGLVQNVLNNWHHHFGVDVPSLRLFEIRPTFHATKPIQAYSEMETGMDERWKLSAVMTGDQLSTSLQADLKPVDFYDLKAVTENILETLGVRGARILAPNHPQASGAVGALEQALQWFHPGQSAILLIGKDPAGVFGRIHPGLDREMKLKAPVWMLELDWDLLSRSARGAYEAPKYKAWGAFPSMDRDFALLVDQKVSAASLSQSALKAGKPLLKSVRVFDVYRGGQIPAGMQSIALRLVLGDDSRVLQESETEAACQRIQEAWKKELGAEVRG